MRPTRHGVRFCGNRHRGPGVGPGNERSRSMNNIIYIVGLVVVVIAVLSFFGMR